MLLGNKPLPEPMLTQLYVMSPSYAKNQATMS